MVVIQTPGYLERAQSGMINVIDEFQFLSFHNLKDFMDRDMYYNLVFMSATPHVALLGAIKEAGIKVT